ncbi:lysozyme inhibitor LprI family protein [Oceanobacillus sp. Castelsardo]|uniref:lysozyme inhibitor LprI family protein n=1 Tax=Oceanobacillus sp. Castelsardo TaxID=1851204 RepID=UPI000838E819|nr:lysozyme inhibitor LprI family protein [Oceanobacillus sp. Castelsardo]
MKSFIKIFLGILIISVFLVACGGSNESKIIGSWKVVSDGKVGSYMEMNEDRMIVRKESNDGPMTVDYILTETQDDSFILEIVNPESGLNEFLFEGYFEDKDNIIVTNTSDGATEEDYRMIRVDNIAEDKAKEKVKEEKRQEQEEKENEEKRIKEQEEQKKEEIRSQKQMENEQSKEKDLTQQTAEENSLRNEYLQKADNLEEKIISEAKKLYAQDMVSGFYGQYYGEWDDLLQEVWVVLKETMPKDAFEELKMDQKEWIDRKEKKFAEMPDEHASSRAAGMDFLANETSDRTYFLIENYMD